MQQIKQLKLMKKIDDKIRIDEWTRMIKISIMTKSNSLIIMNSAAYLGNKTFAIDGKVMIVKDCEITEMDLHGTYIIEEDYRRVRNLVTPPTVD